LPRAAAATGIAVSVTTDRNVGARVDTLPAVVVYAIPSALRIGGGQTRASLGDIGRVGADVRIALLRGEAIAGAHARNAAAAIDRAFEHRRAFRAERALGLVGELTHVPRGKKQTALTARAVARLLASRVAAAKGTRERTETIAVDQAPLCQRYFRIVVGRASDRVENRRRDQTPPYRAERNA
jgi:hypothetical protein